MKTAQNKVARHRARMRSTGLRPVQFWVMDTRSPEYVERIRQQCLELNASNSAEEAEVMRFAEAAARLIEGWE